MPSGFTRSFGCERRHADGLDARISAALDAARGLRFDPLRLNSPCRLAPFGSRRLDILGRREDAELLLDKSPSPRQRCPSASAWWRGSSCRAGSVPSVRAPRVAEIEDGAGYIATATCPCGTFVRRTIDEAAPVDPLDDVPQGTATLERRTPFMNIDLLRRLCETPGVPGREHRVCAFIEQELEGLADEMRVDAMGSLLTVRRATKPGEGDPLKVMLLWPHGRDRLSRQPHLGRRLRVGRSRRRVRSAQPLQPPRARLHIGRRPERRS